MFQRIRWTFPYFQRLCRTSVLFSVFLGATVIAAQEYLQEFEDVTTRLHVDEALGFSLEYPYEWEPSANPIAASDFYVGAPFAMPSFSLSVSDAPADTSDNESLGSIDISEYNEPDSVDSSAVDLGGHHAAKHVIRWTTADAGRHFVETTIYIVVVDGYRYELTVNQSYRDTRWRPRLQTLVDSFRVLDNDA